VADGEYQRGGLIGFGGPHRDHGESQENLHEDDYAQGDGGGAEGGMLLHHGHAHDQDEDEDGDDQGADDVRHHADEVVTKQRTQGNLNHYQDQGISGDATQRGPTFVG